MNLLAEAVAWIADPTRWSGAGSIPERLGEHLLLTAAVIGISLVVAVPLGVYVGHTGRGRAGLVAVAGGIRAIPTLGLITLLGLWLGIGLQAPFLALIVLAVPSLLAGTYAGIDAVDRVVVEAARGMGMRELQVVGVELRLAAPVLVGGLRAAVLQVVATATLAAYVADVGLGRFLFSGLKTQQYDAMLGSSLLVAALAIVLELLLATAQRRARRAAAP